MVGREVLEKSSLVWIGREWRIANYQLLTISSIDFARKSQQVALIERVQFVDRFDQRCREVDGILRFADLRKATQQTPSRYADIIIYLDPNYEILLDVIFESLIILFGKLGIPVSAPPLPNLS